MVLTVYKHLVFAKCYNINRNNNNSSTSSSRTAIAIVIIIITILITIHKSFSGVIIYKVQSFKIVCYPFDQFQNNY